MWLFATGGPVLAGGKKAGIKLNIKLADIIHEQSKNMPVYTNTSILFGCIIQVRGEEGLYK